MATTPQVFVVESLRFQDEQQNLFEGKILSRMLNLSGSKPKYIYLRTKKELKQVIEHFKDSNFRYLHFSCHGNDHSIGLTLDHLDFIELSKMLRPNLKNRRVFFSSCKVMNEKLAGALLRNTGCYSVIGPSKSINFDRAAAFWSSFYHLMLRDEAPSMKHDHLQQCVSSLQKVFGIQMKYFSASSSASKGFKEVALTS